MKKVGGGLSVRHSNALGIAFVRFRPIVKLTVECLSENVCRLLYFLFIVILHPGLEIRWPKVEGLS